MESNSRCIQSSQNGKVLGVLNYRFFLYSDFISVTYLLTADDVFMHNEIQRKEYVLNDMGMYFYGAGNQVGHAAWYFGQVQTL